MNLPNFCLKFNAVRRKVITFVLNETLHVNEQLLTFKECQFYTFLKKLIQIFSFILIFPFA